MHMHAMPMIVADLTGSRYASKFRLHPVAVVSAAFRHIIH